MNHIALVSKHFKSIFFGGNWTDVNVKDTIETISLENANHKFKDCNNIADLVFHINYYIEGILPVFDGFALEIRDKFSYNTPNFVTEQQWNTFKNKVLENAITLHQKVSELREEQLLQPFTHEKYGTYYINIHGIIEHTHYHLGQIVIIQKLLEKNA